MSFIVLAKIISIYNRMIDSLSKLKDTLRFPTELFSLERKIHNFSGTVTKETLHIYVLFQNDEYLGYWISISSEMNKDGKIQSEGRKTQCFFSSKIKTLSVIKCILEKRKIISNGFWTELTKKDLKT